MIWLILLITLAVALIWPLVLVAALKYDWLKTVTDLYEHLNVVTKLGSETNRGLKNLADVVETHFSQHGRHPQEQPGESDGPQGQA